MDDGRSRSPQGAAPARELTRDMPWKPRRRSVATTDAQRLDIADSE
jgi:hypothetical protein